MTPKQRRSLQVGDLLLPRSEGLPVIIMGERDSNKLDYGSKAGKRKAYLLHDNGREYWMADIEVQIKYRKP
tara:strand:+ start:154 stop:366 length:213 start_codon:yes stop_codon:yes gene_type:complete